MVLHAAERPLGRSAFVDTIPPTVTITPGGGTFGGPSVAVTVEWCDNASLNSGTRVLTLDGASQSDTYTTGTKTGCGRYATSTLTLSLSPGSHTFYSAISDNFANQGTGSATFTYAQTYTVTVTPTPSGSTVASYADGQQSFTVHNTGTGNTDYTLTGC